MPNWDDFQAQAPELAQFGAERLTAAPAYLATLRSVGTPRVHPIAPIIGGGRLLVFVEPTSPKGRDLRERGWYALHNGVPDTFGSGGEFFVRGQATHLDDPESAPWRPRRPRINRKIGHSVRVWGRRSSLQRLWRRGSGQGSSDKRAISRHPSSVRAPMLPSDVLGTTAG